MMLGWGRKLGNEEEVQIWTRVELILIMWVRGYWTSSPVTQTDQQRNEIGPFLVLSLALAIDEEVVGSFPNLGPVNKHGLNLHLAQSSGP